MRTWASLRSLQLQEWMVSVIGTGVVGGVPKRSAMTYAAERDVQQTFCARESIPFGEVSFDFSKCFDMLPRDLLIDYAIHRGMPLGIANSLRRFLRGSVRRIVFRSYVSEELGGDRGVPQGNALSVVLAILWGNEWHRQCTSLISTSALTVAYLDDLSVSSVQASDLLRTIGFTVQFAQDWGTCLNESKSAVVLSQEAIQRWDMGESRLPSHGAWDFLGICLGPQKHSTRSRARVEAALVRVRRIVSLPGSLDQKAAMVSLLVTPLGLRVVFRESSDEADDGPYRCRLASSVDFCQIWGPEGVGLECDPPLYDVSYHYVVDGM